MRHSGRQRRHRDGCSVYRECVIVMPFHSCILDCAIHLFDLPVCPWMVRIGEAMLDPICGADHFDPRMYLMFNDPIAWLLTKLNAVAHSDLLSLI